jgi:aminoglycoside phosphotransferase (APT) family kinase protein
MSQPWQPEHVVTPELARQLIEKQFSLLAPVQVDVLGEGFDNTVYQVNREYVFRFPRREMSVELLQTEGRLLPALTEILPLAIPQPLFYGQPDLGYPWPFLGCRMIKGMTPERVAEPKRLEAAKPLAEFLRVLHSFPVEKAIECGVPPSDTIKRLDLAYRKPQVKENFAKAAALGLLPDIRGLERYIAEIEIEEVPQQKCLVHGDLHIRNFLIDEEGFVTGIVDWGDTHIGHPAVDLAIAYSYLPAEGRRVFFETYGEVDHRVKELARFRAIHLTLVLLLYGHDQGQEQLVEAAKESLRLALAN